MRGLARLLLLAALWLGARPEAAMAEGIAVGSFCIEGVHKTDVPNSTTVTNDGTVTYRRYRHISLGSGRVVLFNRHIAQDLAELPTCANMKASAQAQGAQVLLEGKIVSLDLTVGHRVSAGSQNSFIIPPGKFSLTIARVSAGFSRIGGGRLDLSGSRAWIENPTRINISSAGTTGLFRIESWNRRLAGASLRLAGGAQATGDFLVSGGSNIAFDLDTATGQARLYDANLVAANLSFSNGNLDGEAAIFEAVAVSAKRANVVARKGQLSIAVSDVSGQAERGQVGGRPNLLFQQAQLRWIKAEAPGQQSDATFISEPLGFAGLSVAGAAELRVADQVLAAGGTQTDYRVLGRQDVGGVVRMTSPTTPALDFVLPSGAVSVLELTMSGRPDAPDLAGSMVTSRLSVSGLRFAAPGRLAFSAKAAQSELRIPLKLSLSNIAGDFEIAEPNQDILLRATLRRLLLAGDIVVDLGNVAASRLEVPKSRLLLHLDAAAAAKPILAGIKPTLASTGVVAENETPLIVRRAGATGLIGLETPVLILGQPVLKVGSAGTSARVAVDIKAEGGASLRYDLASSAMSLAAADLRVRDADVNPLDQGLIIDAGGFLVREPRLRVQRLHVKLVKGETRGTVAGAGLSLAGSRVSKPAPRPTDVAIEGRITKPFSIATLAGVARVDAKEIALESLQLGQVGFGLGGADLRFGEGFKLDDASIDLHAVQARSVTGPQAEAAGTAGLFFTDLKIQAAGKLRSSGTFDLDVSPTLSGLELLLSGRSDRLSGQGKAALSPLLGKLTVPLSTGFTCAAGNKLEVPVTARLATGPSSLTIAAADGDFSAEGSFIAFGVNLSFAGDKRCSTRPDKHVIQKEVMGSMTGLCPTLRKPFRKCTWKTVIVPEISVTYEIEMRILGLTASAYLENPRIRFGSKTQFLCNVGSMRLIAPAIVGGYYPQLSNPTVLNDVINAIIQGIAIPVESAIATGLLNVAAITFNAADTVLMPVGSTVCILKGEWS
jgi:hypothetical protein